MRLRIAVTMMVAIAALLVLEPYSRKQIAVPAKTVTNQTLQLKPQPESQSSETPETFETPPPLGPNASSPTAATTDAELPLEVRQHVLECGPGGCAFPTVPVPVFVDRFDIGAGPTAALFGRMCFRVSMDEAQWQGICGGRSAGAGQWSVAFATRSPATVETKHTLRDEGHALRSLVLRADATLPYAGKLTHQYPPPADANGPFAHIYYQHDGRAGANLGHALFRALGLLRTASALKAARPRPMVVVVAVLDENTRTMGPFLKLLLAASRHIDHVLVLPDACQQVDDTQKMAVDAAKPTRALSDVFSQVQPVGAAGAVPGATKVPKLQCFDNVVLSTRGGPYFFRLPDAATVRAVADLRQDLVGRWGLQSACEGSTVRRVLVIQRRTTRVIENIDNVTTAVQAAVDRAGACRGRSGACTVSTVVLEEQPSLAAQAGLFSCADVVVAVHGAALAWSAVMRDRTGLVEVLPPGWQAIVDPAGPPVFAALTDRRLRHVVTLPDTSSSSRAGKAELFVRNFSLPLPFLHQLSRAVGSMLR